MSSPKTKKMIRAEHQKHVFRSVDRTDRKHSPAKSKEALSNLLIEKQQEDRFYSEDGAHGSSSFFYVNNIPSTLTGKAIPD